MANVDLVDLLPILKAILRVKEEYKLALDTTEVDFGVYPVLTENFLDKSYNDGYAVGFLQCINDYIGSTEGIEIPTPRQMREVVPTNFSDSGDQDYDTLTDIMVYCLGIRQNLKTILDLDTDLFELYPPQLITLAGGQYAAGLNDGYIAGLSYIEGMTVLPPTINYANNYFWLTSTQSAIPTLEIFYKVGSLDGDWIPYIAGTNLPIDDDTRVYAYCAVGTKNSEVASRLCTYDDFLTPTISFSNNSIYINSNYYDGSGVKTKYKLSTWENYNEFVDYDGDPIPITETATVWAYNYLGDQVSTTVEGTYTPTITPATRPATPEIFFSSQTNIVTITCGTPGAKIYWKKAGTNTWVEYNGAFKIVEDGTYTAMAILDGVESLESSPVTCNVSISGGGVTPSTPAEVVAPTILCNNNKIYVYTSQSGVSLKIYKVSSNAIYGQPGHVDPANNMNVRQWYDYSTPVSISESGTYMAMAVLTSDSTKWAQSTELECRYVSVTPGSGSNPGGGSGSSTDEYVAPPIISCNSSFVSITAITAGSTIKYKRMDENEWHDYTEPFSIEESFYYEAKAIKNGYESSITSFYCNANYIPPTPIDPSLYKNQYLTIEITDENGGFLYNTNDGTKATYQYKLNNSNEWQNLGTGINLSHGDKVMLRFPDYLTTQQLWTNRLFCSSSFIAYGNALSLLWGDDFYNHEYPPLYRNSLDYLFAGQGITSAQNLVMPKSGSMKGMFMNCTSLIYGPSILPSVELDTQCYYRMFRGCTSLMSAPELPAAIVPYYSCYEEMFYNCSNLQHIKCLATYHDESHNDKPWNVTNNMCVGVPNTGVFTMSNLSEMTLDLYSIPSDWTIQRQNIVFYNNLSNYINITQNGSIITITNPVGATIEYYLTNDYQNISIQGDAWTKYTGPFNANSNYCLIRLVTEYQISDKVVYNIQQ